ncbi:MAG: hypothetical protein OQK24_05220 [Magnetovibrio sp.]|nr:hypothetical protein [Magnetovibrio sp.]
MLIIFAIVLMLIFGYIAFALFVQNDSLSFGSLFSGLFGLGAMGAAIMINPHYNVWVQGLTGAAELARAEQNRQIRINEAKAKKEAAVFEAEAEIARAHGVAEANKIIADSLGGPEGYLRWRYIEMLQETGGKGRETVYIPTEAGMPILEANRLKSKSLTKEK